MLQRKIKKAWRKLFGKPHPKPWTTSARARQAMAAVARFPRHPRAPLHGLPAPLIVSLTSYPPRFPYLLPTLKSLLDQTIRPDKIMLWIAHGDVEQLPKEVTDLAGDLLVIKPCDDLRNFKRLVPMLQETPNSFLCFADDDIFYPANWLERLVKAFDPRERTVICYRASRIGHQADGTLTPYRTWPETFDRQSELPSDDLLPVTQMGVLYPPGSLPPQAGDYSLIQTLSPTSDEVWMLFMFKQAGFKAKRVPGKSPKFAEWPGSQEHALWRMHRGGTKDEHFRTMSDYFGNP